MNWSALYPMHFSSDNNIVAKETVNAVKFADIGCGYGGLLGRVNKLCYNYFVITIGIFKNQRL